MDDRLDYNAGMTDKPDTPGTRGTHDGPPPLPTGLVDRLVESYHSHERTQHIDTCFMPSRARVIELIELLRRVVFPGFFDGMRVTGSTLSEHVSQLLVEVRDVLYEQVHEAIHYDLNRTVSAGPNGQGEVKRCDTCSHDATTVFMDRLPEVRRLLATDVDAAFKGDPASVGVDETVFCYPGIDAIFIYRLAHELYQLKVPLLPRIMTEYAHNETGIDIHPGATIGESFFIDHGTGVVIGETAQIGDRVQMYQGVTLGARAPKDGERWRGRKRHPTIEDDVTIYGGVIILSDITVKAGATIGGSVFITEDVPAGSTVTMIRPELKVRAPRQRAR